MRAGRATAIRLMCLLGACTLAPSLARPSAAETTDPQRVEERLPDQPAREQPGNAPVHVDDADLASIPVFGLTSVRVEGATALDPREIDGCTASLIGQQVGAASLSGLTDCVTRLYRSRDFFLSRAMIPPQQVQGGALTLRVIEGYIAAVEPTGIDHPEVDGQFAETYAERPARLATFERSLLLLSDRYGHRVTSSRLAADPSDPARFTLKLAVDVKPVTWRVFGDNRGDAFQGPEQGLISVAWNSPFGTTDRIIAQTFTAPANTNELFFAELGYGRSWFDGLFWTEVAASTSNSSSGGTIPDFTSTSDRIYARVTVPLLRSREHSIWAKLQFDAREAEVLDISAYHTDEHTRVLRGSLSYTLVKGATRADVTVEAFHGLDALGASSNGDANLSRADARPQFTKLRFDASATRKVFAKLDVALMGAAQWADGALPAAEEFGAGGARYGRAYDYSEIVGDNGIAGALELRWTWKKLNDWMNSVQLYAFADAAQIWNLGPTGPEEASLSSAGGGLRVSVAPGILATVEVAKPLTRDVASQGDRSPRVFVSLAAGW